MKVILIGTIVQDTIQLVDDTQSKSLGGLFHTINAARAVLKSQDEIIPISFVGSNLYETLITELKKDVRINTAALIKCDQPNNTVELIYKNSEERFERSLHPMPTLKFEDLLPINDADLILVNMISGWDIDLDSFLKLKSKYPSLISIDLHSLFLKRNPDGTRHSQPYKNIESWMEGADLIQLNEKEYNTIIKNSILPEEFLLEACFETNKIINLTKGSNGSETYIINDKNIKKVKTSAHCEIDVLDPTGSGDVFLSAFGVNYFNSNDVEYSAERANLVAALAGTFKGVADPDMLKQMIEVHSREVA